MSTTYVVTRIQHDLTKIDPSAPFQWELTAESPLMAAVAAHEAAGLALVPAQFSRMTGNLGRPGVFRDIFSSEADPTEYFVAEAVS